MAYDRYYAKTCKFVKEWNWICPVGKEVPVRPEPDAVCSQRRWNILRGFLSCRPIRGLFRRALFRGEVCLETQGKFTRLCIGNGVQALGSVQHGPDLVAGGKRQADEVGGDLELGVPDEVIDRLDGMGECCNIIETEHGPRSLDGMHGPEYLSYDSKVFRVLLQFDEGVLKVCEELVCLFPVQIFLIVHSMLPQR